MGQLTSNENDSHGGKGGLLLFSLLSFRAISWHLTINSLELQSRVVAARKRYAPKMDLTERTIPGASLGQSPDTTGIQSAFKVFGRLLCTGI